MYIYIQITGCLVLYCLPPMRHLLIIVNDKLANGKDGLSVWIHEIIIDHCSIWIGLTIFNILLL